MNLTHLFFGNLSLAALPLDEPLTLYGAGGVLGLGLLTVLATLTYFKLWRTVWHDWICSVDHKKIGLMYIFLALLMMARGVIQALLMRAHQAVALGVGPDAGILHLQQYSQFFSEHGVIMIFFVAMPLVFGLINIILPLQIGARDVAYPYLNSLSFWLTFVAAMMLMVSLLVGNFGRAGWLAYPPISEKAFSPDVGIDYFIWSLQIAGVGSILGGINVLVTIFRMRCPGMTWMRMPVFVWSSFVAMLLVAVSFPILTVCLALLSFDRLFDMHFFTQHAGGNVMMYINMIWAWGHPEVYILVLPAFGVFSEVVATFARKKLYGYKTMVWAIAAIGILSFIVWLHHFFTMGAGANVNAFFGIATMIIAIPTGVKLFNWIFTLYRGQITFTTPVLWLMAFFTTFALGGMTGVLMSLPVVDFQVHNSLFLVAHFHNTIIGGVVFGLFAAITYWFPKAFGFRLDERRGKYAWFFWVVGFYLAFLPLYGLGLMGVPRRMHHYIDPAYQPYFILAAVGAVLIFIGFLCQVWQVVYSIKHREALRDHTGDAWGTGRTLEWSVPSPVPFYNFAHQPEVSQLDDFWYRKQAGKAVAKATDYQPIHMPKPTPFGLYIALCAGLCGFAIIWHMLIPGLLGFLGIIGLLVIKSFNEDTEYYVQPDEIAAIEQALRG